MEQQQRRAFRARLRDRVAFDVPLARLSTYRIGGPAAVLVSPSSADDITNALRLSHELGVGWIAVGLGSNLLFADEGFDGVVIRLGKGLAGIRVGGEENREWHVGAGVPTPIVAKRSAAAGCAGLHRLIGVPGTVGGGVFMNAGAHGQEFKDVVAEVELVGAEGTPAVVPGAEIAWRYRESGLVGVVVSATLRLTPGDPAVLQKEMRGYLGHRRSKTPFDRPCCGSVFRNPDAAACAAVTDVAPPHTAGRLIEAAGLKGFRIGGAEVSTLHANYVINAGGATARDVKAVIDHIERRVRDRFGIDLRREVEYMTSGVSPN